jgi:hypothetical protein
VARITSITLLSILVVVGCKTSDDAVTGKYVRPDAPGIGQPKGEQPAEEDASDERPDRDAREGDAEEERPRTYVAEPEVPDGLTFQETALARTVAKFGKGMAFKPVLEGDQCGPASEIRASATYGAHDDWYTIDDCDRAVSAAHALSYRRAITPFGVLDVSGVAIRHNADDVWTLADVCKAMRDAEEVCPTDYVAKFVLIQSMVGPIVSFVVTTDEVIGGEDPSRRQEGKTLDGRTGRPAEFTAMVTESSILDALKRNTYLRRKLPLSELVNAESIAEIFDLWRTQDFAHFGSYYFVDWSAEENRVAMRLQFLHSFTGDDAELQELEIWVEPKPKFKKAFEAADQKKRGFFWSEE